MINKEHNQLTYRGPRMEANNMDNPYQAVEDFFSCFSITELDNACRSFMKDGLCTIKERALIKMVRRLSSFIIPSWKC
jgi:hypothetical protein